MKAKARAHTYNVAAVRQTRWQGGNWPTVGESSQASVGTVVNIATDKAADPTCVLGYSKRDIRTADR